MKEDQEWYIGIYGIEASKPDKLPDVEEVKLCEKWIKKFCELQKGKSEIYSSYQFKHYVENYYDTYISNGAFIQAMFNQGYVVYPNSVNANFNVWPRKWKEYLKEEKRRLKK